jgi:hypothetical protein
MKGQQREWALQRIENTVRIDLSKASLVSGKDADAIVSATDEYWSCRAGERTRRHGESPEGLARVLNAPNGLTERYGVQLIVSQI